MDNSKHNTRLRPFHGGQSVAAEISSVESEISQLLVRLQFVGTHLVEQNAAHSRRVRQIADEFVEPLKMLRVLRYEIDASCASKSTSTTAMVMTMEDRFNLLAS